MNKQRNGRWIFLFEVIVMLVMGIMLIIQWRKNQDIDMDIMEWESDYIEYDSINGWFADDKDLHVDGDIDIIYKPGIPLKRGTYCVKIAYNSEFDQSCLVYADSDPSYFKLKTGRAILSRNYDYLVYDFRVKEDLDDCGIAISWNGEGYFQILNVSLAQTSMGMIRGIAIVAGFFVCFDLAFLKWNYIKKHRKVFLSLTGIIILTSMPLFMEGIANGHDFSFHMQRIEAISREIRSGKIPVRISSAYMDGYGYPVSVYYGDLLLYIPSIMRLIGFSLTEVYKFYVFLVNFGTVVLTYFCMKNVFQNEKIALVTCLAYSASTYRMINIFERAAVGEYSAMMFIPLVAMAVYKIYTDDVTNYRQYKRNAVWLVIGMSGLIGTHILSTEMTVAVLLVVCLSLMKLTFRKNTLKVYIWAVLGSCEVSSYFLVPFLDYSINVPSKISATMEKNGLDIQKRGMDVAEYFTFFRDIHHDGTEFAKERMLLSPGIVLVATLIAAIALLLNNQGNKIVRALVMYACLTVALTLNIFPWDYLSSKSRLVNMAAQVQFPWRYVSMVTIILTLLLGELLMQVEDGTKQKLFMGIITTVNCLMACYLLGNYIDGGVFKYLYDGAELSSYSVSTGEYLRAGTNRELFPTYKTDVYSENMREAVIVDRNSTDMMLYCTASEQEEGLMWLPLFNYKGYHVTDEKGNEYPIKDNYNNQIEISVPAGFEGYIQVEFKEPWYWRLSEAISLISVFGFGMKQIGARGSFKGMLGRRLKKIKHV